MVSLSGGGKRAAALAYGALLGIEKVSFKLPNGTDSNLFQQVDFIAGVSGGATVATHYAINKQFPERFHLFSDFLYEKTERHLILQSLFPFNWFHSAAYIQGNYFDSALYEKKQFKDLPNWPYLIIGSTDLSKGGGFYFSRTEFSCIGSDLDKYQLGHAVAASAAFPLFIGTMPLENFNFPPDELSRELNRDRGHYLHLSDGGVTDNLAINPYIPLLHKGYLIGDQSGQPRKLAKTLIWVRVDGSSHVEPTFDNSFVTRSVASRMERALDVVFEQQVSETTKKIECEFTSKLDVLGISYIPFRVDLRDAPDDIKNRLRQIPTRWTLDSEDIKLLIEAGERMISDQRKAIEDTQEAFEKHGP